MRSLYRRRHRPPGSAPAAGSQKHVTLARPRVQSSSSSSSSTKYMYCGPTTRHSKGCAWSARFSIYIRFKYILEVADAGLVSSKFR
eukprot:scaffold62840_cov51-Phaeocystis_antarctica.AAC.2